MDKNHCRVCNTRIQQMCRKGTGICGEICQKRDEDPPAGVTASPYPTEPPKGSEDLVSRSA